MGLLARPLSLQKILQAHHLANWLPVAGTGKLAELSSASKQSNGGLGLWLALRHLTGGKHPTLIVAKLTHPIR